MNKPTARFLPSMIASFMLLTGPATVEAASQGRQEFGGWEPHSGWEQRSSSEQRGGWRQSGQASWYGSWHQGRRTSSGQPFDLNAMTAAHANLPLGSRVRVTSKDTGKSVVVTINDRQPPKPQRVIDLSRGAAARIGLVGQGVGMVDLATIGTVPEEVAEAPEERFGRSAPFNLRQYDRQHTLHAPP